MAVPDESNYNTKKGIIMENGTRLYPQSTSNPNVPEDTFLIAEVTTMSGEIVETYYVTREGYPYKVTDWSGHKPQTVYQSELCKITGDTGNMIVHRYCNHFTDIDRPKEG